MEVSVKSLLSEVDIALMTVEPVQENVGTVRISATAISNLPPVRNAKYYARVDSTNRTARAGRDFVDVDEKYFHFEWDGFEEFVDEAGETRYRQTAYIDVAIIDNKWPEDRNISRSNCTPTQVWDHSVSAA